MSATRPSDPYPEISWWGWGEPAEVPSLPAGMLTLLRDALGVKGPRPAPESIAQLELPEARISEAVRTELAAFLGEANVRSDAEPRARHTRGKSTVDLLRLRARDALDAPDLVLAPATHDEVLAVLRVCSGARVAVVPFGGGTSVVGGLEPETGGFAGLVAIDLRRMNALVELDEVSRLAVLEPGLRGPQAEELLAEHGFTIGHHPQSFEYATIGGFAATRSSGQASAGYGRFDDLVMALRVATPSGTVAFGRAPKSAAGPDLRQLILGSEGALGVITQVTVQVRPVPERREYDGWRFRSFDAGAGALRHLLQDGPVPTVVRLSDEAETAVNLAAPAEVGQAAGEGGCLAIIGYEGRADEVGLRREGVSAVLAEQGGEPDPAAGQGWVRDRFRGPYLRDALLNAGALIETLETACFWSALPGLYRAVGDALRESLSAQGTPPVVLCHISHVYASGASLYFTVGCAQAEDPIAQWRQAKVAASDAILAAGGSITHHHGVGLDHREWFLQEIGPLAAEVLRAAKKVLDPAGILNPGILIGEPGGVDERT